MLLSCNNKVKGYRCYYLSKYQIIVLGDIKILKFHKINIGLNKTLE